MERISAPWSDEQIAALNRFQLQPWAHPFTCPKSHVFHWTPGTMPTEWDTDDLYEKLGESLRLSSVRLVATPSGWICPVELCVYEQDWAFELMLNTDWKVYYGLSAE